MINSVTALVLTFNEQLNIARTLDSIKWVDEILVVDSGSTDDTLKIIRGYENARVIHRDFVTFAEQCNFGLTQVNTNWVLSIDADYSFPANVKEAVFSAINDEGVAGHRAEFEYAIYGGVVKGSILPPRTILYKKRLAHYVDVGHGHKVAIRGELALLPFKVTHDDRKPLSTWLTSQLRYVVKEVDLLSREDVAFSFPDKVRKKILFAPLMVFVLVYFFRGGFLSGWRGLFYATQRLFAELLLSLYLIDRKLRKGKEDE